MAGSGIEARGGSDLSRSSAAVPGSFNQGLACVLGKKEASGSGMGDGGSSLLRMSAQPQPLSRTSQPLTRGSMRLGGGGGGGGRDGEGPAPAMARGLGRTSIHRGEGC